MFRRAATQRLPTLLAISLGIAAIVGAGCSSDGESAQGAVEDTAAVTALVNWAAGEMPPEVDEQGDVEPPIVYVTTESGGTLDAGLQATVVESTSDAATVRFADDRSEAIDDTSELLPVHDDGVMLVIGELPDPARTVTVDVEWYRSIDETSNLVITITSDASGAIVTDSSSG
jgi:hypothetical protein